MIFPGLERLLIQGRVWLQDAYLKIKEISADEFTSEPGTQPTTPPPDHFYFYGKENSDNVAAPHWKDENGNEHEFAGMGDIITDHGGLTGLADDDHTQYLKEKASGGLAAEIPLHAHTGATEAGQLDHGAALTGLTDDDHTQYLKEKASGGLASEIPEHDHTSSGEGGAITSGYFEPLTNGIVADPELIFASGDVIMVEIP